jgi:hypothetical protein
MEDCAIHLANPFSAASGDDFAVADDVALRASFAWYQQQPRRPVDFTFEDRLLGAASLNARAAARIGIAPGVRRASAAPAR